MALYRLHRLMVGGQRFYKREEGFRWLLEGGRGRTENSVKVALASLEHNGI